MKPFFNFAGMNLVILSLFLLSACTSHQQYRSDYQLCTSDTPETDCKTSTVQEYRNPASSDQDYLLGFVEFDDQGQLWDRQQMRKVLDQLYIYSENQDLLMVVFVHGWKHSAKAGDDNINSFRETLKHLSAMESAISKHSGVVPRKIAGIYIGWRGGSMCLPVFKELTFWDRKNTAHKVGYGGTTEVLSRLELLQKTKHQIARQEKRENNTRLIVVGHSFGGAVVFSALSEILENGFVQTRGPDGIVSSTIGFADLVVLINPAFEAIRYTSLSDMSTERGAYFSSQLPALAVLTSEADYATKFAFPAGRWVSTLFEKEREATRYNPVIKQEEIIDQGMANVAAIGHFDDYKTHYLRANAASADTPETGFDLSGEVDLFLSVSDKWEQDHPGSKIVFNGSTLERTMDSTGRNPYMNIRVDRKLIRDHNDIYDPRIESFLRQLIMISSQNPQLESRRLLRSKTMIK